MAYTKTNWVNNNEPAINADNLNHLEDGVEKAYGVELLAVVDTAPSECSVGDKYFNTTTNKIYEATATDNWDTEGYDAESGVFYVVFSERAIYIYNGTTLISASASNEISISTTQPTGDEVLWINPNEVPTGQGSYISNTYGTSQEIGYSQEYVNNHFGKSLWTGSFTSGSINVPDLDKYKIIGIVADGVFCIGNKSFGGGIYGIYGGTGNGIVSYRLSNNGTTLSINSNDKGAYNNGTQVAITEIIGIM